MAVTSAGTGTQTAVVSTEHTLATASSAGVYVLVVDTSNLALGDSVTLRMKTKYASGGTSRLAYSQTYTNPQIEPNKYSIPVPIDEQLVCTLTQTAGVAKDFYWNLLVM